VVVLLQLKVVALAVLLLSALSGVATAGVIFVSEDVADFGNFNQRAFPSACQNNPTVACGPTAVLNSFVYLQKTYPQIYGNRLIANTPNGPSNTLNALSRLMGCCAGTSPQNLLAGKMDYIDGNRAKKVTGVAPGTTTFASQFLRYNALGTMPTQQGTIPTMNFLLDQLGEMEDVEALIGFFRVTTTIVRGMQVTNYIYSGAHYVTVTGASFNSVNNNMQFGPGDTPNCISFIDPFGRNTTTTSGAIATCANLNNFMLPATVSNPITGNFLQIGNYFGAVGTSPVSSGLTDENTRTLILGLFAESPVRPRNVPEPASLFLLASSVTGLFMLRRRRMTDDT
jgi:hypothetical protein